MTKCGWCRPRPAERLAARRTILPTRSHACLRDKERKTAMTFEAPISRWQERILPEWLDYNGHMNVAYFMLVFDHGTDAFYPLIGLGKPYRQRTGKSTFAVESHITYQRELSVNEE